MSALESIITVAGSGAVSAVLVAVVNRLQRRDALDADAARDERREETASHKREDRVLERLHDECREDVRKLGERLDARDRQYELVIVDLARCEEQHQEQRRVNEEQRADNTELRDRIARLERRSNPPLTTEIAE